MIKKSRHISITTYPIFWYSGCLAKVNPPGVSVHMKWCIHNKKYLFYKEYEKNIARKKNNALFLIIAYSWSHLVFFSYLTLLPVLYQKLYQTVPFESSANSSWFCPARGERNSNGGLRSVWLPQGIPEETLRGCLVDYEQLRLKGSERRKLCDRSIQVNSDTTNRRGVTT